MNTEEVLIVHPKTSEEISALKAFMRALKIKFEVAKREDYDPEFVAKVLKSEEQVAAGKTKRIKRDELKEFLGL